MSATDHGPSNHDDELSRALRDLVDDASLPGLDAHLDVVRGRTRRRRAAKKVALGATTLCVAGALGVAAITLPQGVRPTPVAPAESPSPSATPTETPAPAPTFPVGIDAAALACQQPAPIPTGDDLPAHLSVGVPDLTVQTAGSVTAPVLLRFDGDARLRYADSATGAHVITRDGVIISSPLPAAETTGEATPTPGSSATWELDLASSASCDPTSTQPSPLPAGDYEVFALHRFPLTGYSALQADGTWGEETTGALFDGWLVADPVPLTIAPEPDPVEVRDALVDDTSAVFEALREAATTGKPAAVDLFFDTGPEQIVQLVDGAGATRTLTVPPHSDVSPRERATSDDGWVMSLHGGAKFSDTDQAGYVFTRLIGTFDVTLDTTAPLPTFTLEVVDGTTPDVAPPSKDKKLCTTFAQGEGPSNTYSAFASDLVTLTSDDKAAITSPVYQTIRARWVEAPRVWWALQSHEVLARNSGDGGDLINAACLRYWGQ